MFLATLFFMLSVGGSLSLPVSNITAKLLTDSDSSLVDEPSGIFPLLDSNIQQSLSSRQLSLFTNSGIKDPIRILYLPIAWEKYPEDGYQTVECDIPCSYTGELSDDSVLKADGVVFHIPMFSGTPDGVLQTMGLDQDQVFTVATSMESTGYYTTQFDYISSFDIEMTFRLSSDIPLPYFSFSRNILEPINDYPWEERVPAVVFMASNCASVSQRENLVQILQKFVRVDSVSKCLNNVEWPSDIPRSDKLSLLRRYMVYLAAENCIEKDYVTEKVNDGLIAGAIPIYFGAPNIYDFVPPRSVIAIPKNFTQSDIERVAKTVRKIFTDKKEYERWTAFKTLPHERALVNRFNFTHTNSNCRLCKKIFSLKHKGYDWDQENQQIVTL